MGLGLGCELRVGWLGILTRVKNGLERIKAVPRTCKMFAAIEYTLAMQRRSIFFSPIALERRFFSHLLQIGAENV